jgi:hypothetical protein
MKKKQYQHPVCLVMKMRPIHMLLNSPPKDPEQEDDLYYDPDDSTNEVL